MKNISFKDEEIDQLSIDNDNIVLPWGIEFADSSSFYSSESGIGLRYTENLIGTKKCINLTSGKFLLDSNTTVTASEVNRSICATAQTDAELMDFVLRYRFKKDSVTKMEIAGNPIHHTGSNIYHQYKTDRIKVYFSNGREGSITLQSATVPKGMQQVMYVRDQRNEWVVHIRFIPVQYDKEVIKVCTSWARTKPLPQFLSKIILSNDKIKKYLWYKTELRPYQNIFVRYFINLAAYPLVKIARNSQLKISACFKIEND